MKKFGFLLVLYVALFAFGKVQSIVMADAPQTISVLTNTENIYSLPNLSSAPLGVVSFRTQLACTGEITNAETKFFEVSYDGGTGYVLASHAMDASLSELRTFLDTNAFLKAEATLFVKTGENFVLANVPNLESGSAIRLIDGYKQTGYSQIMFERDGVVLTYYCPAECIKSSGLNRNAIIAISMLVTCVSLVLIILGIKFGNKKKIGEIHVNR